MEKVTDELFNEESINETIDQDLNNKVRKDLIRPLFINIVTAIIFAIVLYFIFDIKIHDLEKRLENYTTLQDNLEKANKRLNDLNSLTKLIDLNKLTTELNNNINVVLFKLDKTAEKNEKAISFFNNSLNNINKTATNFETYFNNLKKYDLNATKIDELIKQLNAISQKVVISSQYAKNNIKDIETIRDFISKAKDPSLIDIPTELIYQRVIDKLENKDGKKPTISADNKELPFKLDSIINDSIIVVYIPSSDKYLKLNVKTDAISDRYEVTNVNIKGEEVIFFDRTSKKSYILKPNRKLL